MHLHLRTGSDVVLHMPSQEVPTGIHTREKTSVLLVLGCHKHLIRRAADVRLISKLNVGIIINLGWSSELERRSVVSASVESAISGGTEGLLGSCTD